MFSTFWRITVLHWLLLYIVSDVLAGPTVTPHPRVVICPFSTIHEEDQQFSKLAGTLTDLLMIELGKSDQVQVVDRSMTDQIFSELILSGTGIVRREASAALIGRIAKADIAVAGILIEVDGNQYAIVRAFHPVSGILLSVDKILLHDSRPTGAITDISAFIHEAANKAENKDTKRYFAFGKFQSTSNNRQWQGYAEALKAELEKRYLETKDIGIVVRTQAEALVVEHYLASSTSTERANCLADAKIATAIIDIRLDVDSRGSRSELWVTSTIVGFGKVFRKIKLDYDDPYRFSSALLHWMDQWLQVNTVEVEVEQKQQARQYYYRAMELGRYAYKTSNGLTSLYQNNSNIFQIGYEFRKYAMKNLDSPSIVELFEKALVLDPSLYDAMPPLAYTYLNSETFDPKRGREILVEVLIGSSTPNLFETAKKIAMGSRIGKSNFTEFTGDSEGLFHSLVKAKYIDEQGYLLSQMDYIKSPAELELLAPYAHLKEEVYWLLKVPFPRDRFRYSSSSAEAIIHYCQGLQESGFRFKAGKTRHFLPKNFDEHMGNYEWWAPGILSSNLKTQNASLRRKYLKTAINDFATALSIDPGFHEAMLMLAQCLRDPLIMQNDRADRIFRTVLSESPYQYFRELAKASISRENDSVGGSMSGSKVSRHDVITPNKVKPQTGEKNVTPQAKALVVLPAMTKSPQYEIENPDCKREPGSVRGNLKNNMHPEIETTHLRIEETQVELLTPQSSNEIFSVRMPSSKAILHLDRTYLGTSVAISEDFAVIAAPWANQAEGDTRYGALFVFKHDGACSTYSSKLLSRRPALQFGYAVDIDKARILAGAPNDSYKGPVLLKDFHGINFKSNIAPDRLLDKLFERGYLDTYRVFTDKSIDDLKEALERDFPECTTGEILKIENILKTSEARKYSGSAYLFEYSDDGWQGKAILSAADGCPENHFGRYVAISEDHAVIGSRSGAYFYHINDGQWSQTAKMPQCREGVMTGWSDDSLSEAKDVDVMGNYAICAANYSAIIFLWDGNQWVQQATLNEDPLLVRNREYFGTAVAIGTDFAVVSNKWQHVPNDPQGSTSGAVYVYKRIDSNWPLWATLTGEQNGQVDSFGEAVAISGNNILVTASSVQHEGHKKAAAVYLYEVQDAQIIHRGRVSVAGDKKVAGFGCSIAIHGQKVVVGANRADDIDEQGRKTSEGGAAYLFEWSRK